MTKTDEKMLATSWMRRLKNGEFTYLMSMVGRVLQKTIDNKGFADLQMKRFKELNAELQKMRPVQTKHSATKVIHKYHKKRVDRLLFLLNYFTTRSECFIMDKEELAPFEALRNVFSSYGTRFYDMGISNLTGVIDWIVADINDNPELLDTIMSLNVRADYNALIEYNQQVVDAQFTRAMDQAKARPKRTYVEVRRDIYKCFRDIQIGMRLSLTVDVCTKEIELATNMLEYYFNDFKSTLIQYEKRREQQKAKSASQESNVNESVNVNENINVKVNLVNVDNVEGSNKAVNVEVVNVERENKANNVKVVNVDRPNKAVNVNTHDNVNNDVNVNKTVEVAKIASHQPEHELQPATHDTKLPQHDATLQHTVSQPEVEHITTPVSQSTAITNFLDKVSSAVPIETDIHISPINLRLIKWNGERWEITDGQNKEPKKEKESGIKIKA